jgi:hypothetical protein
MYQITITEEQLKEILNHVRNSGQADRRFDLNLAEGKLSESAFADVLGGKSFEVKRDYKASQTKNIAIEYECRGKPSGIAVTEAEVWAIDLGRGTWVVIETQRLKELAKAHWRNRVIGGDVGSNTKMVLIPLSQLAS